MRDLLERLRFWLEDFLWLWGWLIWLCVISLAVGFLNGVALYYVFKVLLA